eukprot:CAMPEP_0206532954 /NCGR_PEP_ID=MMETSP0325_2-20121206/4681_1 /ASSEMBLY_ACC=CAM_ASM_000347 /TAXON_ID=2866 /ORGANISM="Crypthecodinium cohnii, Strain Seligo" /LENGTH=220 /DNA_ID=CAMNT_0054029513 /DNA_START=690 /DNA_END=1355 /DNA_ORIENTATION=-
MGEQFGGQRPGFERRQDVEDAYSVVALATLSCKTWVNCAPGHIDPSIGSKDSPFPKMPLEMLIRGADVQQLQYLETARAVVRDVIGEEEAWVAFMLKISSGHTSILFHSNCQPVEGIKFHLTGAAGCEASVPPGLQDVDIKHVDDVLIPDAKIAVVLSKAKLGGCQRVSCEVVLPHSRKLVKHDTTIYHGGFTLLVVGLLRPMQTSPDDLGLIEGVAQVK